MKTSRNAFHFVKPLTHAILIAMAAGAATSYADSDRKTELPKADAVVRIDPMLERLAAQQTSLPVIIIFGEQPQRKIARALNEKYEPQIDALAARVRGIYDKYLPRDNQDTEDKEIEHSKKLSQYVTDADKKEIRVLNEEREKLMRELRQQIARESAAAVAEVQKVYAGRISSLGAKIQENYATLNAISAEIPVAALKEIASLSGVAEIVYNNPGKAELSNQVQSLGADTWWASGFDGGVWDVGVLDEGVLETHDALKSHTF